MDLPLGRYFLTISHFIHLKEHKAMLHITCIWFPWCSTGKTEKKNTGDGKTKNKNKKVLKEWKYVIVYSVIPVPAPPTIVEAKKEINEQSDMFAVKTVLFCKYQLKS